MWDAKWQHEKPVEQENETKKENKGGDIAAGVAKSSRQKN